MELSSREVRLIVAYEWTIIVREVFVPVLGKSIYHVHASGEGIVYAQEYWDDETEATDRAESLLKHIKEANRNESNRPDEG